MTPNYPATQSLAEIQPRHALEAQASTRDVLRVEHTPDGTPGSGRCSRGVTFHYTDRTSQYFAPHKER